MSKLVETFQADLPTRVFRVTNAFNEAVYLAANEPSLGMYRLQEHIQTNVPKVVQQKQTLQRVRSYRRYMYSVLNYLSLCRCSKR